MRRKRSRERLARRKSRFGNDFAYVEPLNGKTSGGSLQPKPHGERMSRLTHSREAESVNLGAGIAKHVRKMGVVHRRIRSAELQEGVDQLFSQCPRTTLRRRRNVWQVVSECDRFHHLAVFRCNSSFRPYHNIVGNPSQAVAKCAIRLDDPEVANEIACQNERANWVASRIGLPTIGSKLVNQHGIEWVVQNHATVPHYDSLQRWRLGDVWPEQDMYPVVAPQNLSPQLTEFFHAIDRCTTKTFAILDTMPGRRKDGHIPGGNSIDTLCNPETNVLLLDAARVHETVIAHELGHAWVQYVDECEDHRTMKDASDPQRMRQVSFVQSFVLDLKVNDLIWRKGFDMSPIEDDQAKSLQQLADAFEQGYEPGHPREEVFMALLVADEILQRDRGRKHELAKFDRSLQIIRDRRSDLSRLSERLAESVRKHGYDTHSEILSSIDECLIASFEHCGDKFELDSELLAVIPEEPDIDKLPDWLSPLRPKTKCIVGKHMARQEISSHWAQHLEPSITGRAKVSFVSPEKDRRSHVVLHERIGPPSRYSQLDEHTAELLAMKHLNQSGRYQLHGGPPFQSSDLHKRPDLPVPPRSPSLIPQVPNPVVGLGLPIPSTGRPGRPYMAGHGRFLTQVALEMQLAGEHPYAYANLNPITYVDPEGRAPRQIDLWGGLRYKKYCGPGGGPGPAENPIDKCCKDHDWCWGHQKPPCTIFDYQKRGDCWYCDDRLCACLAKNAHVCGTWDLECKVAYEIAVALFCRRNPNPFGTC